MSFDRVFAPYGSEVRRLDGEGVALEVAIRRLPPPAQLDFLREAGATDEELARFQQFEISALWRQINDSAALLVEQLINEEGLQAGVTRCHEWMEGDDSDFYFDVREFNLLGYRFLGQDRIDEAIAVFQLNVDRFPESWNVYDSLGEAYVAKGETQRAIELYRRSVEINAENTNGVQALERLEARPPTEG